MKLTEKDIGRAVVYRIGKIHVSGTIRKINNNSQPPSVELVNSDLSPGPTLSQRVIQPYTSKHQTFVMNIHPAARCRQDPKAHKKTFAIYVHGLVLDGSLRSTERDAWCGAWEKITELDGRLRSAGVQTRGALTKVKLTPRIQDPQ